MLLQDCVKNPLYPKVSVIIPIYNSEKYLESCLDSVCNQTLKDIEIICVNDGSTDCSGDIIERFAENDARVQVITQKNSGVSAARNVGIAQARGEYIQFVDSDDILINDALKYLIEIAHLNNLDVLYFDAQVIYENAQLEKEKQKYKTSYIRKQDYTAVFEGKEFFVKQRKDKTFQVQPCIQFIRRDFIIQNNILFYEGIIHEDNLFTTAVMIKALRVSHRNKALYIRRIRVDSIVTSQKSFENVYGYLICARELMEYLDFNYIQEDFQLELKGFIDQLLNSAARMFAGLCSFEKEKVNNIKSDERILLETIAILRGQVTFDELGNFNKKISAEIEYTFFRTQEQRMKDGAKIESLQKAREKHREEIAALYETKTLQAAKIESLQKAREKHREEIAALYATKTSQAAKIESLQKAGEKHREEIAALHKKMKCFIYERDSFAKQLHNVKRGWSFKIGRVITWIPRKIKEILK